MDSIKENKICIIRGIHKYNRLDMPNKVRMQKSLLLHAVFRD